MLGANPAASETEALTRTLFQRMKEAGGAIGIGRYDEPRLLYTESLFATGDHPTTARRTLHIGLDLFDAPGLPLFAPLDGTVHTVANNAAKQDFGPLLILAHKTTGGQGEEIPFYTLYGHLGLDLPDMLQPGEQVTAGQQIGTIGAAPANGEWPPHLHFQLSLDLLDLDRDFPGVVHAGQGAVWRSLSPDPNLIAGIPADLFPSDEPSKTETLAGRRRLIGPEFDPVLCGAAQNRAGMDAVSLRRKRPRLSRCLQQRPSCRPLPSQGSRGRPGQMGLLNTNTRYLHDNIVRYAERLTAHLPEPLRVCYFLNSASEANELALRLARAYTGREDLLVMEAAYHGHTGGLIDISPYKFDGPGGRGPRPWVHVAPLPDDYRGSFKRDDPTAGGRYGAQVGEILEKLAGEGKQPAAWICETLPSVGGQIVLPPGYLAEVYRLVRAAGGLCIADEVQVGFGRLGTTFWGFETQGVVPDIVVLGKPIGNGHPLGAVITTAEIAAAFDNGMEFFSTFGGNPVSCAVGLAVLDVLEEENLQQHALAVGGYLLERLEALKRHPLVGDVRGLGLFQGIELVRDRQTLEPADVEASYVVNRLREKGVLAGTDGPLHNVIKIRPPLPFNWADADVLVDHLDEILGEDFLQTGK